MKWEVGAGLSFRNLGVGRDALSTVYTSTKQFTHTPTSARITTDATGQIFLFPSLTDLTLNRVVRTRLSHNTTHSNFLSC